MKFKNLLFFTFALVVANSTLVGMEKKKKKKSPTTTEQTIKQSTQKKLSEEEENKLVEAFHNRLLIEEPKAEKLILTDNEFKKIQTSCIKKLKQKAQTREKALQEELLIKQEKEKQLKKKAQDQAHKEKKEKQRQHLAEAQRKQQQKLREKKRKKEAAEHKKLQEMLEQEKQEMLEQEEKSEEESSEEEIDQQQRINSLNKIETILNQIQQKKQPVDLTITDKDGNNALHRAIINEDVQEMKSILSSGAQLLVPSDKLIQSVTEDNLTAAAFYLTYESALLTLNGCTNKEGYTPYALFKKSTHKGIKKIAEKYKTELCPPSLLPIHHVQSVIMLSLLRDKGANIHAMTNLGETALHMVCDEREQAISLELVKELVEVHKLSCEQKDVHFGEIPLHLLLKNPSKLNNEEVALYMLQHIKNIHITGQDGKTLLHYAAASNYPRVLLELIKRGISIDSIDTYDKTPLYDAAEKSCPATTCVLLIAGADMTLEGSNEDSSESVDDEEETISYTPLQRLEQMRDDEEYKKNQNPLTEETYLILQAAYHINEVNNYLSNKQNHTPLHFAMLKGYFYLTYFLLTQDANTTLKAGKNKFPSSGLTALELAQNSRIKENIRKSVINTHTYSQWKSKSLEKSGLLHFYCTNKSEQEICTLLDWAIPRNAIDTNGQTPIMYAIKAKRADLIPLLVSRGCKLTLVDNKKNNILHLAYATHDAITIKETIEFCKLFNVFKELELEKNDDGQTPIDISLIDENKLEEKK